MLISNKDAEIFFGQGMLTGLLGNLTLLSYFVKKKENEAILVQTLGVVSIYAVIAQLAMAGAMPLLQFTVTTMAVAVGLALNFLNYFQWVQDGIWKLWEDFITIAGLTVLPQVIILGAVGYDDVVNVKLMGSFIDVSGNLVDVCSIRS